MPLQEPFPPVSFCTPEILSITVSAEAPESPETINALP